MVFPTFFNLNLNLAIRSSWSEPQSALSLAFADCIELLHLQLPCISVGKESACSAGDPGLIPELGRSPGEGNGNPLQYPCLENLVDRGAWWAAVYGGPKGSGMTEQLTHSTEKNAHVEAPLIDHHISLVGKAFLAAKGWRHCLIQSFEQSWCYYLCFTEEGIGGSDLSLTRK